MFRFILRAAFFIIFSVSIVFNILAFAGCFQRDLMREKDDLIDRFSLQVDALSNTNIELKKKVHILENTIEDFSATNAWAAREIERIKKKYSELTTGGDNR